MSKQLQERAAILERSGILFDGVETSFSDEIIRVK